jgi:hypothetical protein
VRTLSVMLTAAAAMFVLTSPTLAQLGTDVPPDDVLKAERVTEAGGSTGPGIFDILVPSPGQTYTPAERVKRDKFGVVGPIMQNGVPTGLQPQDLNALVYPSTTDPDKAKLVEGMKFFTMFHDAGEGLGPIPNQPACVGCHLSTAEAVKTKGLLGPNCPGGSTCASNVSRAARSTLTNFDFVALDKNTGGGRAPDNLDAINNTGKTAAFTTFGNFSRTLTDTAMGSIGCFDPLDASLTLSGVVRSGGFHICVDKMGVQQTLPTQAFGGFVQHVRPPRVAGVDVCVPKPLPPLSFDTVLKGSNSGNNPLGFQRSVGERAGPPYIGRGLMEAVPTADITANADPSVENGDSGLGDFSFLLKCPLTGCISGKANMIPRSFAINTSGPNAGTDTGFVGGVGRFGLRANGVEILQFAIGGLQGELSFTSLFNPREINFPTLFPGGTMTAPEPPACFDNLSEPLDITAAINLNKLEVHLSTPFSERNFIRNTSLPEFGDPLLDVLEDALKSNGHGKRRHGNSKKDRDAAMVQRGAELFGIDLVAFAKRTISNKAIPATGGLEDNAIADDRGLNCVGCHTPIRRTGQSPTALTASGVGSYNLSYKWAPIFSDQLLHRMPVISAERETTDGLPRDIVVISRSSSTKGNDDEDRGHDDFGKGKGNDKGIFKTLDLPRNLSDDTFSNLKATAEGSEFRTAPLMGLGRIGPPLLHDARVYLSKDTVDKTPAGTVTTNREVTNAPLVVRSLDDAILAAIELHDLPAPDDKDTPRMAGSGCPVPPDAGSKDFNVHYGANPKDVICPRYNSTTSETNRSDAREVIYRFRQLSSDDQQAVIEFLKQL